MNIPGLERRAPQYKIKRFEEEELVMMVGSKRRGRVIGEPYFEHRGEVFLIQVGRTDQ